MTLVIFSNFVSMRCTILCILFTLLFFGGSLSAQNDDFATGYEVVVKRADNFFESYEYRKALELYKKALKYKDHDSLKLRIADTYYQLHDLEQSKTWYDEVFISYKDVKAKHYLNYSKLLVNTGDYSKAKKWIHYFEDKTGVLDKVPSLEDIEYLQKSRSPYSIVLENKLSTSFNEFPTEYIDSNLILVANHTEGEQVQKTTYYQILSFKLDSVYESSNYLKNTQGNKFHFGSLCIYQQNKVLYTRTVPKSNLLKLYSGEIDFEKNKIINQKIIPLVAENSTAAQPTISKDGKTLYFVSDMEGGYGGTDIYKSELVNNNWSKPINLGPIINTKGKEQFPRLVKDSVLYFSSNGHAGLGGLDLYKTLVKGPRKGQVVNLGVPLNSSSDDFALIFSSGESKGFFASNRDVNHDQIYSFAKQKTDKILFEGFAKEYESAPINIGNIIFYDEVTNSIVGHADHTGFVKIELEKDKEYRLRSKVLEKKKMVFLYITSFNLKAVENKYDKLMIYDRANGEKIEVKSDEDDRKFYEVFENHEYTVIVDGGNNATELIQIEGQVTDTLNENIGPVIFYNTFLHERISRSDDNGHFKLLIESDENIDFKIKEVDEHHLFEVAFEGFLKHGQVDTALFDFQITDEEDRIVYNTREDSYTKFILDSEEDYYFKAKAKNIQLSDTASFYLEGFMKDPEKKLLSSNLSFSDGERTLSVQPNDSTGVFSLRMENNKEYKISAYKTKLNDSYEFLLDGFFRNYNDSSSGLIFDFEGVEDGKYVFDQDNGFVEVVWKEDHTHIVKVQSGEGEKMEIPYRYHQFEGLIQNANLPVMAGGVIVFDASNNKPLFETDEYGFFNSDFKADSTYRIYAKRKEGETDENVVFKINGFVKDQQNNFKITSITLENETTDYIASNKHKEGYFSFKMKENQVYNFKAHEEDDASEKDFQNVELIAIHRLGKVIQVLLLDTDGTKAREVLKTDDSLSITVSHKELSTNALEEININLMEVKSYLKKKEKKAKTEILTLSSVYYNTGEYTLSNTAKNQLKSISDVMKKYSNLSIVVTSFADTIGTKADNQLLSSKRTGVTVKYLVSKGIDRKRIKEYAKGEHADKECFNCRKSKLELNRRTDFYFLTY